MFYQMVRPHQWPHGSALKADRWEVPGSILGRTCRPSRLEFFMVFTEIRVNTCWDPFSTVGTPLRPRVQAIGLNPIT